MSEKLLGTYRLNRSIFYTESGEKHELFSPDSEGFLIFAEHGMMSLTILPKNAPEGMGTVFTAGTFKTSGDEFTYAIQVADDVDLVGEEKTRNFELGDNNRLLKVSASEFYLPGIGKVTAELDWVRAE